MSPLAVFEKSSENLHFYFLKWWKFYAKKLRFFVFLFTCKKQKKWSYWWDSLQCGQMEVYFNMAEVGSWVGGSKNNIVNGYFGTIVLLPHCMAHVKS